MDDRFSAYARSCAGLIAIMALTGLIVQFGASTASLGSAEAAAWHLLQFFTILTNTGVAVTFTGVALARSAFGSPGFIGGMTLSILLVGVIYNLLLAGSVVLTGGEIYANVIMHYAVPILVPLYWLAYVPKGFLRAHDPLIWAAYPLVYLAYALIRGGISGHYPYFFLDVGKSGWATVASNATEISAGFLAGGYVIVRLDRRLAKTAPAIIPLDPAPPGA
jgi:hypothetical protein